MTLGSVVFDEVIVPIDSIELVCHAVVVRGRIYGPRKAATGYVRVFAPDGQPVTDGHAVAGKLAMPDIGEGDVFEATTTLSLQPDHC